VRIDHLPQLPDYVAVGVQCRVPVGEQRPHRHRGDRLRVDGLPPRRHLRIPSSPVRLIFAMERLNLAAGDICY